MRCRVALLTVCFALVMVSEAGASATPAGAKVTSGSVWTLQSGGACETDSFGTHHSFSATGSSSGGNGDEGTYRQSHRLTMRWTAGTSVGGIFEGAFHKRDDEYLGTYIDAGVSTPANLEPLSKIGCPEVTATVAPDPQTLGDSLTDSVSVTGSGGVTPAGWVGFSVCPGDTDPCDPNAADAVDLGTVDVTGTGNTVSATNTFRPTTTGSYCFSDVYVGDDHYSPVFDASIANHCFTVTPAGSVVTSAPASASVGLGTSDTDTATVTSTADGVVPTGTVTFYECGPDTTATACTVPTPASGTGTEVGSPVTLVPGADATTTATSAAFTPTASGTYCFVAVYSGDANTTSGSDGSTTGECFTVEPASSSESMDVGLVALNKYGPHEVLGGGTGEFVVSGDIFLNTDVPTNPWSGNSGGWGWDDAIDAKDGSTLNVYGTIDSQTSTYDAQQVWPLDTCFEPEGVIGDVQTSPDPDTQTQLSSGLPPSVQMTCAEYTGSVSINYDDINPNNAQINDPMQANGAPPDPLDTSLPCPGQTAMAQNPTPTVVNGVTDYAPGQYTTPVDITGSAIFESCPGGSSGVYDFEDGLAIDPAAGDTVSGSNIVIATQTPYPMGGNVPGSGTGSAFVASGSGNGAPRLPAGTMTSVPSGAGTSEHEATTNACGGTNPTTYGVVAYTDSPIAPDPTMSGTGNNFSLMAGGAGTVNLSGPTSGVFGGANGQPGVVLYQDPSTQANYGFNAEPGDAATINLTGVVYNASLADYGADSPLDYWDGIGGGVPFYAGGTLQTGYGTGWSDGPAESGGTVTITGTAIVDDFNTEGSTAITILERPYGFPAVQSSVVHRKVDHKRS
jgi:hypothetical protein